MSDTYTQLYIQLVFAVRSRNSFIQPAWEEEMYKYITAVVQNDKHKMLAINGSGSIISGGITRNFIFHAPGAGVAANLSMVLVFHGDGLQGLLHRKLIRPQSDAATELPLQNHFP